MDAYQKTVKTAVAKQLASRLQEFDAEYGIFESIASIHCETTVTADSLRNWADISVNYILDGDEERGSFTLVELVAISENAEEIVHYLKQ